MTIWKKLLVPFPEAAVSWRVGSTNADKTKGIALAYIDARDVMRRLDDVVGPDNWSDSYIETPKGRIICTITVHFDGRSVSKSDGAGETDVEGEKGALSDAFKRAAVKFGIGRYLYDLQSPWVELEAAGKSYRIKPSEHAKLERLLRGSVAPEASKPAPKQEPKPAPFDDSVIQVGVLDDGKSDWRNWAKLMVARIKTVPNKAILDAFMFVHGSALDNLKKESLPAYDHIIKAAADRFPA